MPSDEKQADAKPHISDGLKAAADTTKQIITLASGIVALTVTFAKEFKPANSELTVPYELKAAWVFYGLSLLLGVAVLLAITGSLANPAHPNAQAGAMGSNVRIPSFLMIACFVIAFALTIAAGFSVVR